MTRSWVDAPVDRSRAYRATTYVWDDETRDWREAARESPHYGGSGVFSTLEDLARWDAALYRDDSLGEGFGALMLSRRRFQHDKDNDALGLVHGKYRGHPTVWYAATITA